MTGWLAFEGDPWLASLSWRLEAYPAGPAPELGFPIAAEGELKLQELTFGMSAQESPRLAGEGVDIIWPESGATIGAFDDGSPGPLDMEYPPMGDP